MTTRKCQACSVLAKPGSGPRANVVPLFGKRPFSFTNLDTANALEAIVAREIDLSDFTAGTLVVRVHSVNVAGDATIKVIARETAPSDDEPETEFKLNQPLAQVEIDAGTTAPTMKLDVLEPGFGSHVQIAVEGTQRSSSTGTVEAELSAELVAKINQPSPALIRTFTHHMYDRGNADLVYIPLNSAGEQTTLSTGTNQARWIAPHDGWLEAVYVYFSAAGSNDTTVGLHLDNNTTAETSLTETVEGRITKKFKFGRDAAFLKEMTRSISVDPSTAPTDVNVTCEWMFKVGS